MTNEKLRKYFIISWISILCYELNIDQDNIYFHSMYKGSGHLSFSIKGGDDIDEKKLEKIKKGREGIKDIRYDLLIKGCILSPKMFDTQYNNNDDGWAKKGEKRGGRKYNPPYGWIGYGLNVRNKYDLQDNTWLGMRNIKGEWWVAYHGAARSMDNDKTKNVIKNILNNGFIAGKNQMHQTFNNQNNLSKKDYKKVGVGLYLSDKISTAELYSGTVEYLNHR